MKCILSYEEVDISRPTVTPCCLITEQHETSDIKNVKSLNDVLENGHIFKTVRESLANNNKTSLCYKCWHDEDNNIISHRILENNLRKDNNNVLLRSFNIALDNTCNMMCRMCSPTYSSKWKSSNLYPETASFNDCVLDIVKNSDLKNVTTIRILGGEPFYSKKLSTFLDLLLEKTDYKNVKIIFSTNGSIFPSEVILKKLYKFKKVKIEISIDAINDLSQLCRWGVEWNIIDENIKKWNQTQFQVQFHTVISVYNCNKLSNLLEYANSQNIWVHFTKLLDPLYLRIDILDIEDRKKWLVKQDFYKNIVNPILLSNDDSFDKITAKQKFKEFNTVLDKYQGISLESYNKEIYDLV